MRILTLLIPILLLIVSCKPVKEIVEVPIETIKTEYIHDIKIDSVFVKDSIDRWRNGDTLYIYKEHTKYKYLNRTDTIIRTDTIPKVIKLETVKTVEINHIKWYQKSLMWIGGIMLLLTILYILYKLKIKKLI